VEEQEPAEGQIHRYRQAEFFAGLGDGEDLGECCGSGGDGIPSAGVNVNGEDSPRCPHDFSECHRDLAASGADVSTGPTFTELDALECGGQWSPIDVVSQSKWSNHSSSLPW
jgi:hypothetical protein